MLQMYFRLIACNVGRKANYQTMWKWMNFCLRGSKRRNMNNSKKNEKKKKNYLIQRKKEGMQKYKNATKILRRIFIMSNIKTTKQVSGASKTAKEFITLSYCHIYYTFGYIILFPHILVLEWHTQMLEKIALLMILMNQPA